MEQRLVTILTSLVVTHLRQTGALTIEHVTETAVLTELGNLVTHVAEVPVAAALPEVLVVQDPDLQEAPAAGVQILAVRTEEAGIRNMTAEKQLLLNTPRDAVKCNVTVAALNFTTPVVGTAV